jgi:hypothetical protein
MKQLVARVFFRSVAITATLAFGLALSTQTVFASAGLDASPNIAPNALESDIDSQSPESISLSGDLSSVVTTSVADHLEFTNLLLSEGQDNAIGLEGIANSANLTTERPGGARVPEPQTLTFFATLGFIALTRVRRNR